MNCNYLLPVYIGMRFIVLYMNSLTIRVSVREDIDMSKIGLIMPSLKISNLVGTENNCIFSVTKNHLGIIPGRAGYTCYFTPCIKREKN